MTSALKALMVLGVTSTMLLAGGACTDALDSGPISDCVEVYPNTGATRRPGYTRAACEQRCQTIQGALDCYWDEDTAHRLADVRRLALGANEIHDFSGLGVPAEPKL